MTRNPTPSNSSPIASRIRQLEDQGCSNFVPSLFHSALGTMFSKKREIRAGFHFGRSYGSGASSDEVLRLRSARLGRLLPLIPRGALLVPVSKLVQKRQNRARQRGASPFRHLCQTATIIIWKDRCCCLLLPAKMKQTSKGSTSRD